MNADIADKSRVAAEPGADLGAVGWLGAGKMGAPMIRNLLAAGASVAVTDPDDTTRAELVKRGATDAKSLAAQSGSRIVFSTLPNDAVLRDVIFGSGGAGGLLAHLAKGSVLVEMSTISPECSAEIADATEKAGILYLRAPLSGSTTMAEAATLTVLASGEQRAWDIALPLIKLLSARQFYLGQSEEARYMKLVINTLVGATSAILAEAMALGASGGLSSASMMEVLCESAVASPLLKYKAATVIADDYAPAFSVQQMIKDFSLISDAGRANGVPLMTTGLILELYRAAANSGLRDQDFFALVKWQSNISH